MPENHPSFKSLDHDWVDALSVFIRAHINRASIQRIYTEVAIEVGSRTSCFPVLPRYDGKYTLQFSPLAHLPKVERIEIICGAIVMALDDLEIEKDSDVIAQVIGCAIGGVSVRERWRRIGFALDPRYENSSQSLIARMFEDRPKCGWCPAPMITGSESTARPDLHEGCYQYIMDVVRPQVIADRKREQEAYKARGNTDG